MYFFQNQALQIIPPLSNFIEIHIESPDQLWEFKTAAYTYELCCNLLQKCLPDSNKPAVRGIKTPFWTKFPVSDRANSKWCLIFSSSSPACHSDTLSCYRSSAVTSPKPPKTHKKNFKVPHDVWLGLNSSAVIEASSHPTTFSFLLCMACKQ